MTQQPLPNNRLAFQYYPDSEHYRESDFQTWLPALKSLGSGWLVLRAPADRAIPEAFLKALLAAGIQPILHFHLSPLQPPKPQDLYPLFQSYARWGVRYIALFDRPNSRATWNGASWARQDLVANFLDMYAPLADAAMQAGLINIFPPLEPGGDYWDTAFLQAALTGLQNRPQSALLKRMALGVYAWADNLPLDWGAGGPECWPGAQPYYTPPGEEDHLGFRIFDWYAAISEAALGQRLPLVGLGGGCRFSQQRPEHPPLDPEGHAEASLHLMQLLDGSDNTGMPPLPPLVLACSLGLLTATTDDPQVGDAWFPPDSSPRPAAAILQAAQAGRQPRPAPKNLPRIASARHQPGLEEPAPLPAPPEPAHAAATRLETIAGPKSGSHAPVPTGKSIRHYLLLPTYEWGVADWHLEVIQPFLKRHLPTIGFSIEEAASAVRVTIVGGPQSFPEAEIDALRAAGCEVLRISGDGTSIATQLESL